VSAATGRAGVGVGCGGTDGTTVARTGRLARAGWSDAGKGEAEDDTRLNGNVGYPVPQVADKK
jgi:hypothetical protein